MLIGKSVAGSVHEDSEARPFERQLSYWRERLDGLQMLQLPTDHPRPSVASFNGASVPFELEESLLGSLRELC